MLDRSRGDRAGLHAGRGGERRAGRGARARQLYVHVDLDVLDASEGRANGYVGGSGITLSGLLEAIQAAGARCPIVAGAITAYDPAYDLDGRVRAAAIEVALALAAGAR